MVMLGLWLGFGQPSFTLVFWKMTPRDKHYTLNWQQACYLTSFSVTPSNRPLATLALSIRDLPRPVRSKHCPDLREEKSQRGDPLLPLSTLLLVRGIQRTGFGVEAHWSRGRKKLAKSSSKTTAGYVDICSVWDKSQLFIRRSYWWFPQAWIVIRWDHL